MARLKADEGTDARVGLAEHVLPRGDFAADQQLVPRAAVAGIELPSSLVVTARVIFVVELPIRRLDRAAAAELEAHARKSATRADAVVQQAPVAPPMTENVAFMTQAVAVDVVYVPSVLPLRELERCGEAFAELRKRNACGQSRVAEPDV